MINQQKLHFNIALADFTDIKIEYSGFTVTLQILLPKGWWYGREIVYIHTGPRVVFFNICFKYHRIEFQSHWHKTESETLERLVTQVPISSVQNLVHGNICIWNRESCYRNTSYCMTAASKAAANSPWSSRPHWHCQGCPWFTSRTPFTHLTKISTDRVKIQTTGLFLQASFERHLRFIFHQDSFINQDHTKSGFSRDGTYIDAV